MKNFFQGFSLIELMISLITISCIAAALTPLITKKVTQSGVSVGVGSLTSDCSSKFSDGCILCDNKECFICSEGYELSSGTCEAGLDCEELHSTGCSTCTEDECSTCKSGYALSAIDNKCYNDWCSTDTSGLIMRVGDLCVTKYNMGDKNLPIPSSVTIVTAGGNTCSATYCCWQGTTSESCDSENGGYSGCTRTLCNWAVADKTCSSYTYNSKTWRLPTLNELTTFAPSTYSINKGTSGLMLCDHDSNDGSARCNASRQCLGANGSYCYPEDVWSSTAGSSSGDYCYSYLKSGSWYSTCYTSTHASSVRCVSDI